jgi:DNA/RNA-binding domain of Phe-tRNA-synthetase-like protein
MGFPIVNLYIDTHIIAEMCHGILMAIQDLDRFNGKWKLDMANEGETFQGVSARMILCKEDEIVLRDEKEIVCSLFQGPDFRTKVDQSSKNVVVDNDLNSSNRPKLMFCWLKTRVTICLQVQLVKWVTLAEIQQ